MSLKSNQLLKTIQKSTENNDPQIRLATIYGSSGNGYRVQFYGEESPTEKAYLRLSNVSIDARKPVMMQKVNGTYVIMGNIAT